MICCKTVRRVAAAARSPAPTRRPAGGSIGPRIIERYGDNKCGACRGTGKELTEAGRAIESVVEHVIEKRKSMYGKI
jgi:hypothetical protein